MTVKTQFAIAGTMLLVSALPLTAALAQDQEQPERQIRLVGCVMHESDYRDTYGPGLSGPRGPGIGQRNEYMLVDAREVASNDAITSDAACPAAGSTFPTAYELTGSREVEIAEYVGRRVVLTGVQKDADVRPVGTSGVLRPTGGFDPLGHELHLFEVEVDTFRDVAAVLAEAAPPPAAPAPEPEREVAAAPAPAPTPTPAPLPPPEVAVQEPEPAPPVEEAPQIAQQLPRTASPLALAGAMGLLSFAGAVGLRALRRRGDRRKRQAAPRVIIGMIWILALPAVAAPQATPVIPQDDPFPIESHWLVSGSLGSDFEADAEDPGVNFAGTAGWLWHGVIGGEFQANFSPDFQIDAAAAAPFLAEEPSISSYMLNVVGALPLMAGGQFQPYVSAGGGWFTMNAEPIPGDASIDLNHTETGWNAGVGAMGFLGQMGIRADLRYFAVGGDEFAGVDGDVLRAQHGAVVDDQEPGVNGDLLSGASFWRGNVGVALRW